MKSISLNYKKQNLFKLGVYDCHYPSSIFKKLIRMKNSSTVLIFVVILFFSSFRLFASSTCASSNYHKIKLQTDTAYLQRSMEYQKVIHNYVQQEKAKALESGAKVKQVYTVPVVVHVMHLGEAIGTGTNISDAQIQAAVAKLNASFRGTNGIGVDTEIEFCLASQDPNGCPSTGINRVNATSIPNYTAKGISYYNTCGAADEYLLKDLSRWTAYYYYNIWIVNKIDCSTTTYTGYASPPNGSPYDGAVILASEMTGTSNALTHQVGHGFGLFDTYEGDFGGVTCPPNSNCATDGDQICDTPPHKQTDCGSSNPCSAAGNWDNSRYNYMSGCGALDRFTADQKTVMRSTFIGFPRALLLISKGCVLSNFASQISKTDVSCFGVCDGTISVVPGCPGTYTYLWSNGNTTNSLSALCGGTYTLSLTDANNYTASIPVTVAEPTLINVVPNVNDLSCTGNIDGSIALNVSGGVPFTCGSDFTIGIGNGTVVSSNTQYPAPFGNYKWGAKHQIFFHQSELQSLGFSSGKIKSVSLNVASLAGTTTYKNFQIQMKAIPNVGSLTSIQSGLQNVFGPQTVNITTGWNTFYFTTPLQWNGSTSIIIQFCFNDSVQTFNSPVFSTTTSFKSVVYVAKDSIGVCNLLPSSAQSAFKRPNVRFGVCNDSLNYKYLWGGGQTTNSLSSLDTGVYSVTVRDMNGCYNSVFIPVQQGFASANAGTDTLINLGGSAVLGGNPSAGGRPPFIYSWTPANGLNSSTSANPIASPSTNTTFYLAVTDSNLCTAYDTVTVLVNTSIGIQKMNSYGKLSVTLLVNENNAFLKAKGIANGNYLIELYDVLGKKCKENNFNIANQELDQSISIVDLPPGLYFVSVQNENERVLLKIKK